MSFTDQQASSYDTWPTREKPESMYKITSLWIELSQSKTIIERSTYDVLEWLGDIGGLFDAFRWIGFFIISPIASMKLKEQVMLHTFHQDD